MTLLDRVAELSKLITPPKTISKVTRRSIGVCQGCAYCTSAYRRGGKWKYLYVEKCEKYGSRHLHIRCALKDKTIHPVSECSGRQHQEYVGYHTHKDVVTRLSEYLESYGWTLDVEVGVSDRSRADIIATRLNSGTTRTCMFEVKPARCSFSEARGGIAQCVGYRVGSPSSEVFLVAPSVYSMDLVQYIDILPSWLGLVKYNNSIGFQVASGDNVLATTNT